MEYKSKQSADTKKVDMIELEVHMSLNFESSLYVSFTLHTVFLSRKMNTQFRFEKTGSNYSIIPIMLICILVWLPDGRLFVFANVSSA